MSIFIYGLRYSSLHTYVYSHIFKVVEPDEVFNKTGLAYLHTSHCLANGDIMISAMGDPEGKKKGEEVTYILLQLKF